MKVGRVTGIACLAVLSCFCGVRAQAPGDQEYTISMDVKRVVLYVTVHEGKAAFVSDLTKADFTVKEDGKVQEIRQFVREEVPAAIGLVIDNSQSMMNKRDEVIAAAKAFVKASNPKDEMFVVHFGDKVEYGLPQNIAFSSDQEMLATALDRLKAYGRTALYDAIWEALEHLKESKLTKKAIVVISDGGDNESLRKMDQVVRAADLSGALFYAVGIYDALDGDANPGVLRRLARDTGGEAFFPDKISELTDRCESIARDLRNQYMLVYAPADRPGDKAYHKIQVSVKDPKKRSLTVRTRTGYYGDAAAIPAAGGQK
jgi:Ca-activated chloride channel homolog